MQKRFTCPLFRPVTLVATALAAILMLVLVSASLAQSSTDSPVYPPTAHPFGMSYPDWTVAWWKWALARPVDGHPFLNDAFDCNSANNGQSGPVWFLALSPSEEPLVERSCTIPADTAVFIGLANVECSSLERPFFPKGTGATTAEQQIACATFFANHIVEDSLFCTIDGQAVGNLASFRFLSPQFTFAAPTPWIFGKKGGTGTAVSDGYFLMLKPLSSGSHTLSCGGAFDFGFGFGNTYHLTVQ
jgi:hypothetical protein